MLAEKLKKFYRIIEQNRNKHYNKDMGKEPVEYRNAMIGYLMGLVPEDGVWLDLFTGDGVVPLAMLYLGEQGLAPKVRELWVVDDNSSEGFPLVRTNAEALGITPPIIQTIDLVSPTWSEKIECKADFATLIDAVNCIKNPLIFLEELKKRLRDEKSLVQILQAGEIHQSFREDFSKVYLNRSDGFNFVGEKGLSYLSGNPI